MAVRRNVTHVTEPVTAVAGSLPGWAWLARAPNPGPLTLEGTNTWLLRGPGAAAAVVVDPGPADEPHLRAVADRGPVAGILVTHGHPDHVAGLARFQELTGAPVLPPGEHRLAGLTITTLATPGHTADSVCYLVAAGPGSTAGAGAGPSGTAGAGAGPSGTVGAERVVLTGDTILGRGTTVVAWPDGNLGDYLASLARLAELTGRPALPGHGPALADCGAAAGYYRQHRLARLEQIRAVVATGVTSAAEIVRTVYGGVDRALWPAAEWSVSASLAYLGVASGDPTSAPRESGSGSPPLEKP